MRGDTDTETEVLFIWAIAPRIVCGVGVGGGGGRQTERSPFEHRLNNEGTLRKFCCCCCSSSSSSSSSSLFVCLLACFVFLCFALWVLSSAKLGLNISWLN